MRLIDADKIKTDNEEFKKLISSQQTACNIDFIKEALQKEIDSCTDPHSDIDSLWFNALEFALELINKNTIQEN